ncbi:helix-turn-helix transcriptional regulator [Clostridium sediminicola]|uniref:helix-turn-helix domain-containing protein n=1 Tax=Clostridium sediminicola TaxID=3114879 RepID=UPI0031F1EE61
MEVLTVGEKIKRARVYKGLTLKNLCGKDLSVSKLSCIENGKVKPEEWILKTLSKKLGIDYLKLKKGIDEQIVENITQIEKNINFDENNYIKKLMEYAELAHKNKFYFLGFDLTHKLFEFMIEKKNFCKVIDIFRLHYELSNKTSEHNMMVYYFDAATYFYKSGEYVQALNYYKSIKEQLKEKGLNNDKLINQANYYELMCHFHLKNYNEAFELGKLLEELNKKVDCKITKGQTAQILGVLAIRMDKSKCEKYIELTYECYDNDKCRKAEASLDFAIEFIKTGQYEKGLEYIEMSVAEYDKTQKEKYAEFLIKTIEILIEFDMDKDSSTYIETALDLAIQIDRERLIERAYYFKSKYLIRQKNLYYAEMYLNLSLDFLKKFANLKEIYFRYMEMGKFYYDMKNVNDSVKYFTLARNIKDKL